MRIGTTKVAIEEYFYQNPTIKLRIRQIEREINVPLPSAIRYAKELEKERKLQSQVISGIKVYFANRVAKEYLFSKLLFNLKQLRQSGLLDLLIKELNNPVIIVFGSYSIGEDIETSDIDLYIETVSKKKLNLKNYEIKLQRKIQLFIFKDLMIVQSQELRNSIINGFVLNGFLEVFK